MKAILRTMILAGGLLFAPNHTLAGGLDLDIQPYLGAGLGAFNLDAGLGSDTAFGGFGTVGANLNEYLAVEVRVGASADATVTTPVGAGLLTTTSSIDWFVSYLAKPQFPLTGNLNVYGLIGATTLKTSFTTLGSSLTNTSTGFSFGGGLEYKLTDQVSIGGEWVQYASDADLNSPTFPGLDVWGASATIRYQF